MKRRIRRIRRALKRAGLYNAFHITLIAVLLTGFCVILFNVKEPEREKEPETIQAHSRLHDFRNGGAGQMKMREVAERFRHMLKVKDCRHLCLTCEYYEICKREVNADEYEIRNEK